MKVVSNQQPLNVLFLCTGNSARSIMAEVILNRLGRGKFRAFSAGSEPKGQVNPNTLRVLSLAHFDVSGLRSKSWEEFSGPDARNDNVPVFGVLVHGLDELRKSRSHLGPKPYRHVRWHTSRWRACFHHRPIHRCSVSGGI
jgi:hypothetical protein